MSELGERPVASRHGGRRRRRWFVLYPFYLLLWIVAVHYFVFWRPFVAKMRARAVPPQAKLRVPAHMDELTMQRLGSFENTRRTSFANFSETKADGMTRLCAFGDSFTHGDEVIDGHDYPALLQGLFREADFDRVEVLNFGTSWHGFHQSYVMWDAVGRRFHCDYVLLGPSGFYYARDTMFNHTQYVSPYYLHARYILDGDDVRLLEVPGISYAERFADYFRFLPRWQYVRYDRNLLPTLKAILPENRTLPNPLYYFAGSMQTEALATYERLLRKLADDAPQIVILNGDTSVVKTANQLGRANIVAGKLLDTMRFPYRAPGNHFSFFGNQHVARDFFRRLVAHSENRFSIVETSDPPAVIVLATEPPRPLSTYDRVEIRVGEDVIAYLMPTVDKPYPQPPGSAAILKARNVAGLLALRDLKTNLVDASYAEIDFILRPGDEVVLRAIDGSAKQLRLGTVRMLHAAVNVGVIDLVELREVGFGFAIGSKSVKAGSFAPEGTAVELWVGDHPALRGRIGRGSIRVKPLQGESRHFRVWAGQFADLDAPGVVPEFDLVLQDAASTTRVTIATWKRIDVPMPHTDPPLPGRMTLPHGWGAATDGEGS